jgi:hypothetical protein
MKEHSDDIPHDVNTKKVVARMTDSSFTLKDKQDDTNNENDVNFCRIMQGIERILVSITQEKECK